jgi:hypothetical protein
VNFWFLVNSSSSRPPHVTSSGGCRAGWGGR